VAPVSGAVGAGGHRTQSRYAGKHRVGEKGLEPLTSRMWRTYAVSFPTRHPQCTPPCPPAQGLCPGATKNTTPWSPDPHEANVARRVVTPAVNVTCGYQ